MISRRTFLSATALALPAVTLAGLPARAGTDRVFTRRGAAINGYDPVAYFTQSAPVKGDTLYVSTFEGAEWRFASAGNKAMFDADPAKYAPQYGGYCAYAVSQGYTAKTETEAWTIVDDKLYLNYSLKVRDLWSQDIPGNIAAADNNWPGVLN